MIVFLKKEKEKEDYDGVIISFYLYKTVLYKKYINFFLFQWKQTLLENLV
jgi:hypothetical protein